MRLSLGPLQYFWPADQVQAFYRHAQDWPLDILYLGETVCSKRRELRLRDWLALGETAAEQGREVVLSALTLIEAESELSTLRRQIENGRFRIEANDLSAVQLLRERRLPWVAGPGLNIYNADALRLLREDGLQRWVLGVEQGHDLIEEFRGQHVELPELEVIAWGRLPLAYSARCFTARTLDLGKDDCQFRCRDFEEGLRLSTRQAESFLQINGIQVQSAECCDLAPQVSQVQALGVDILRLYPQVAGMSEVIQRFRAALDGEVIAPQHGTINGYWFGQAGRSLVNASP